MNSRWKSAEVIAKKVIITAVLLGAAVLVLYLLPKAIALFLPFITAYIISLIAAPLMRLFDKLHMPRAVSAVISIILVAALLFLSVGGVLYKVAVEVYGFCSNVPDFYDTVTRSVRRLGEMLDVLPNLLPFDISEYTAGLSEQLGTVIMSQSSSVVSALTRSTLNSAKNIPFILIGIVFTILAAFFILSDRENIKSTVKKAVGPTVAEKLRAVRSDLSSAFFAYLKAQGILMCITFCELFAGLSILKIRYSFLIAILIAILDAIPIFGTGTVLLPWAVVSLLTSSFGTAFGLIVLYAICLTVRQFLEPKILSVQIGLHPLATLMSMYVGLRFFGVFGMILAPVILLLVKNFTDRIREN